MHTGRDLLNHVMQQIRTGAIEWLVSLYSCIDHWLLGVCVMIALCVITAWICGDIIIACLPLPPDLSVFPSIVSPNFCRGYICWFFDYIPTLSVKWCEPLYAYVADLVIVVISILSVLYLGSGDGDDGGSSPFTSIGAIIAYIFIGYFLLLFSIVALFCICFVRCNCECINCCSIKFCYRFKCSPKLTRKQRVKCPTFVNKASKKACDQFCSCCDDPHELTFWIEVVILAILCFPFALCCLVLYARSQTGG